MHTLRTYFSAALLAILLFAIVPKEFVHDLYDHSDTTEDEYCLKGVLHVEKIHHHCEMLNYAAFPFEGSADEITFNNLPFIVSAPVGLEYGFINRARYNLSQFRAPPMA